MLPEHLDEIIAHAASLRIDVIDDASGEIGCSIG
jgi:hypothetical protein